MTSETIAMDSIQGQLTAEDDPGAWEKILGVIGEEFVARYRARSTGKRPWFLRIGTCSHWWRSHQARWMAAGGFTWPVGYSGNGWPGLPEFDWSVVLSFDGKRWERVEKFSGNKQVVLRVSVPARTARHKQAAVHTLWSTSQDPVFYGFRNVDGKWRCVAASDEREHGRILKAE